MDTLSVHHLSAPGWVCIPLGLRVGPWLLIATCPLGHISQLQVDHHSALLAAPDEHYQSSPEAVSVPRPRRRVPQRLPLGCSGDRYWTSLCSVPFACAPRCEGHVQHNAEEVLVCNPS